MECPKCESIHIVSINVDKFVCDKWNVCLSCGCEFGQIKQEFVEPISITVEGKEE